MNVFQREINYRGVNLPVDVVRLLEKIETKYFFIVEKAYYELVEIAPKHEKRLAEYLSNLLEDESEEAFFSTLWLANILGDIKSKEAIEPMLKMIIEDNDYFSEEALFNLIKIGQEHEKEVVENTIKANETTMDYFRERSEDSFEQEEDEEEKEESEDKQYGAFRIYYYGVLAEFASSNNKAKNYLIQMFEEDDDYADAIAQYLAVLEDRKIAELFKRRLEFMSSLGDENDYVYREIKYAYYILDKGEKECDLFYDPWKKDEDWKESCFSRLSLLIKKEFKLEKEEKIRLQEIENKWRDGGKKEDEDVDKFSSLSEEKFADLIERDNEKIRTYPISLFNFEKYIQVRQLGLKKESMEKILKKMGVSESVEDLQRIINEQPGPEDVVDILCKNNNRMSEDSRMILEQAVEALGSITPREEYNGLNPVEYDMAMENARSINEQATKIKIGRNEPCPCGSGKKYKKCCME